MTETLTIDKRVSSGLAKTTGLFLSTLLLILSLVLGLSCGVQAQEVAPPARDNVLLITIDDLNDWIGCLSDPADPNSPATHVTGQGHPQASTPHMDRLAQRGVLFTNAHCQAPICRPSRTSFLSGLRPTTTGIYSNSPKHDAQGPLKAGKEVPWLTKRFAEAGYDIFTAGKLLHDSGSGNAPLGGTRCFKTNQGPYPSQKINVPAEITPAGIWDFGAYPEDSENYTDWRIAKWTIDQINSPTKLDTAPRFFAVGFYNPHVPLFAPQEWFDEAPSKKDVLLGATRDGDLDDLPTIAGRIHTRVSFAAPAAWVLEKEERLRGLTQAYLACTSAMDDSLGKVIDALDASDRADNTWIVVLSDHGWHLGEKNHIAKQTLWTRSTRVPMIIVPPKRLTGTRRGVRCDRAVELLDVYPTLVNACNLAPEPGDKRLDGLSLLPWLRNPQAEKERPSITTLYGHNHSVVGDRYRYTRYADGSEELYDQKSDPHEFENLISQVEQRPELKSEIKKLSAFIPTEEAGEPDLILTE